MIYETLSIFLDKDKEIIIRDATIWDAYAVSDLYIEMAKEVDILGTEVDNVAKERFLLYILNQPVKIIVAEDKDKIIGFIMGNIRTNPYENNKLKLYCENWYIKPEYRDCGLGLKILQIGIDDFKKKNKIEMLEFYCKYDNNIINNYKKLGFIPTNVKMIKEV